MQIKKMILQSKTIQIVLVLVSFSVLLNYLNAGNTYIFLSSVVSLIFISKLIGTATEELAKHAGNNFGALVNLLLASAYFWEE